MDSEKPNIVFIFSDQHRGDAMGCAGNPVIKTPSLDRLASEGVLFSRCYTNSPLCMPARASMMTGRFVSEHGVWNNGIEPDRHGPSHVRNIRNAGYHTALVGKTHLYLHQKGGHTRDHVREHRDWGFEDIDEIGGNITSLVLKSSYTDHLEKLGLLDQFMDYARVVYKGAKGGSMKPWEEPPMPLPKEEQLDAFTCRRAVEWLDQYEGDRPFYLQVLPPGPHNPFDAPEAYRQMYAPEHIPPGIMEGLSEPVSPLVGMMKKSHPLDSMTLDQKRRMTINYYAKITLLDEYIGKVIQKLEEKDLLDNTWIIYSSDHGEMLGDHRLVHKCVFHDGAGLIPLIVRPPGGVPVGVPGGVRAWTSRALTDLLDVSATLMDIAGAEPFEKSDGKSLLKKILAGPGVPESQSGKEALFSEVRGYSMVRTEKYKMAVKTKSGEVVELYDMERDPDELQNLAKDPSMEAVRKDLSDNYLRRLLKGLDEKKLDLYLAEKIPVMETFTAMLDKKG